MLLHIGGFSWAVLVAKACVANPRSTAVEVLQKFFRMFGEWEWPKPVTLVDLPNVSQANNPLPQQPYQGTLCIRELSILRCLNSDVRKKFLKAICTFFSLNKFLCFLLQVSKVASTLAWAAAVTTSLTTALLEARLRAATAHGIPRLTLPRGFKSCPSLRPPTLTSIHPSMSATTPRSSSNRRCLWLQELATR